MYLSCYAILQTFAHTNLFTFATMLYCSTGTVKFYMIVHLIIYSFFLLSDLVIADMKTSERMPLAFLNNGSKCKYEFL